VVRRRRHLLPYTDREVRQIVYHTTSDMPYHQIKSSFAIASDWNVVFMEMVRRQRGLDCRRTATTTAGRTTSVESGRVGLLRLPHSSTSPGRRPPRMHAPRTRPTTSTRSVRPTRTRSTTRTSRRALHPDGRSECVVVAKVNSCVRDGRTRSAARSAATAATSSSASCSSRARRSRRRHDARRSADGRDHHG